jgi:hypothetical protein
LIGHLGRFALKTYAQALFPGLLTAAVAALGWLATGIALEDALPDWAALVTGTITGLSLATLVIALVWPSIGRQVLDILLPRRRPSAGDDAVANAA